MTKNSDFESAYKAIVGDFPVSDSQWCHFRQVWQLLHDALLHDFWQKQPFEERRQDLDPIPLALDLLEKFERAQLPLNLTLDNYGEPYNPYFDLQWLCNLRDRAGE